MPAEELLDQYVDRLSVQGETDFMVAQFKAVEAAYEKISNLKLQINGGQSIGEVSALLKEVKANQDQVTASTAKMAEASARVADSFRVQGNSLDENIRLLIQQKLKLEDNTTAQKGFKTQLDAGKISMEQYIEKQTNAIKRQQEYKTSIADLNKELSQAAKADYAIPNSRGDAQAQNAIIQKEVTNTPFDDTARLAELNALLNRNNALIDANSDKLYRQKINIGNYPTEFKAAFGTLESELGKVSAALQSPGLSGKELAELTTKELALKNATALVGKEFSTTTAQSNAYKESARQIGQVYGTNSDVFKTYTAQVSAGVVETKKISDAVNDGAKNSSKLVTGLNSVWGGLRKLAYAIPGIGIGGLVLLLLDPIIALGSAISSTGKKVGDFNDTVRKTDDIIAGTKEQYSKAVSEVDNLKEHVRLAKEGFIDKTKVVDLYNETMGKTTGTVSTLDQVEQSLVKNADAYIKFTLLKAAAQVAATKAADEAFKAEQTRQKDLTEFKNPIADSRVNAFGSTAFNAQEYDKETERIKQAEEARKAALVKKSTDQSDALLKIEKKFNDDAAALALQFGFKFDQAQNAHTENLKVNIQKEIDARRKLLEFEAAQAIQEQKIFSDNPNAPEFARINALNKILEIEKSTIKQRETLELQANDQEKKNAAEKLVEELKNTKQTVAQRQVAQINYLSAERAVQSERLLIIEKSDAEIRDKELATYLSISHIKAQQAIDDIALTQQFYIEQQKRKDVEEKILQEVFNKRKDYLTQGKDIDLISLDQQYARQIAAAKGSKDKLAKVEKDYQVARTKIETDADNYILQAEAEMIRSQIALNKAAGQDTLGLETKLEDIRVKIEDNANKAILKSRKELSAEQHKLHDKEKELAFASADAIIAAVDGAYDKQINSLQTQVDLINTKRDADIAAENATGDAAQVKADKIANINANAAEQQAQLEQQQKKEKIKKAEFDKLSDEAKIIGATAVAVAEALPDIPLSLIVGGIGLAQLLKVIATPIPQYRLGTPKGGHPGGGAITGDGGKAEPIILPSGQVFMSPAVPTFMDLPRGTIVYPDADSIRDDMHRASFKRIGSPSAAGGESPRVEAAINKGMKGIQEAINNKPVAIIKNTYAGVQTSFRTARSRWEWVNKNMQS